MSEESSHQSNDIQNNPIDPKKMECIIKAGIQAPSGDNAQPWQFSYDTDTINLYLDESKDRSFFNISQIASMISCGAVLENMKIAATKFKLVSDIRYGSGKGSVKKVAALVLSMDENIRQDPLAEFIWKRQTNRKLYKKIPVPLKLLKGLKMSINDIPGTEVVFITDPEGLKRIARLVSRADIIRIQRKEVSWEKISVHLCGLCGGIGKCDVTTEDTDVHREGRKREVTQQIRFQKPDPSWIV